MSAGRRIDPDSGPITAHLDDVIARHEAMRREGRGCQCTAVPRLVEMLRVAVEALDDGAAGEHFGWIWPSETLDKLRRMAEGPL